jgi:DNA (cytosine-5)-methyltransferase 1
MEIGVVDLFCGIGGLTYGIQQTGIKVVAGIDLDDSCRYAFEKNNKATFIHKSITDVTGKEIKKILRGYKVKVLVGCAPCQPFSSHQKNKKERKNHKDWSLIYEFARIIEECKPHIISMENVPALMTESVFIDFVKTLESLNYYVDYSIVNVADYGIAQNRRRLILLASRKKKIKILAPTHKNQQITVAEIIGELHPIKAGEVHSIDRLHQASSLSPINIRRIKASKPNGTWRDWPKELILECHKKDSGKTYSSVYGRMSWDGLAPTITTQFSSYGTGRFGHPDQDRALTLREGALLQSFPHNYTFIEDDKPIIIKSISRHIGNAVPPRLGEIVGLSILSCLKK